MGYQSMANADMRDASEATQRRILIETTIANERKSVGIAYLLWFFFGAFGGHNYYVGKPVLGMMQLVGYIAAWGAFLSGVVPVAFLLGAAVGFSLIIDLCFIPARIRPRSCASA
jgi:hypothetical protein